MNWLSRKIQEWRRARESLAMAKEFHASSRARIEQLVREGKGRVVFEENAKLMGIDLTQKSRGRIHSVGGVRFD